VTQRKRDGEDFRTDDLGDNDPYERDSDEPGYDPGPEPDDLPEDREGLQDKLNDLYTLREHFDNQLARLTASIDDVEDEISDLEARVDQLPED
jgi:hypothetical protein